MIISSQFPADWWKSAVIYQIYPRSFYDSDNDGIGDLKGITQKLDYLNDGEGGGLGIDTIWLSPFFPSPMKDFGYDVSDYCGVDPIFGTLNDFEELVQSAHARAMKVVIDLVLNHSSDQHPWFQESKKDRSNPKADWYVWQDPKPGGGLPNNWLSVFGGPGWTFNEDRQQYYYHAFLKEQPDLNWYHPEVREAVAEVFRFWAEKGVDGFRLDTANFYVHDRELRDNPPQPEGHVPLEAREGLEYDKYVTRFSKDRPENFQCLKHIRQTLDALSPHLTTIGEVGGIQDLDELIDLSCSYVKGSEHLHMVYNFGLLGEINIPKVTRLLQLTESRIEDGWLSWSLGNHDCPRLTSRSGGNSDKPGIHQTLLLLLLCLKGTPILYYGDEIEMPEYPIHKEELQDPVGINYWPTYKGRDGCRTPFAWDCQKPNQGFNQGARPWLPAKSPVDLKEEQKKTQGTYALTREMLGLRRNLPALQSGSFELVFHDEHGFLFDRKLGGQSLRIACNLSDSSCQFNLDSETWSVVPLHTFAKQGELDGSVLKLPSFGFSILKKLNESGS
ncbi:MAG: DUF3459 domain-containing protein [SAR324 cluster bacterium]|nr:DUF3459 domain-containing protein [SAR324 cluster bacterium]